MKNLDNLIRNNREWSASIRQEDPEFFQKLARQQAPKYLWIGCSDSRVPANQIVNLMPGELFVHRNVANIVVHTDLNCLSVIQFAVDSLKVEHIIVTGHYGCGGVQAAMNKTSLGLIDNWLLHVQDVRKKHMQCIMASGDHHAQFDRLCEINVLEQVMNVCNTSIVQRAWSRGQELSVHSWIYGLRDGLVRDLGLSVSSIAGAETMYSAALEGLTALKK